MTADRADPPRPVTLFLCGDVMLGRGIDQVLPHPGDPRLHERAVHSAADYVALAERASGPIPKPAAFAYVWGDALDELARVAPDRRIVNLETAVTTRDDWLPKGINYRMHPDNLGCLTAAGIDCCVLANNHVLDWGRAGLVETLAGLRRAGLHTAGAGRTLAEAEAPAVLAIGDAARVLVFGFGARSSGIPDDWAATPDAPGVNLLPDEPDAALARIARQIAAVRRRNDVVVASIHWGPNWGYEIPSAQRRFARELIDAAGVDIVHGHSSHHPKGIEVHRGRLILHGCGDFINDYEGIRGYEAFRGDLALMYFAVVAGGDGALLRLTMTPVRVRRFRLGRAPRADAQWLCDVLSREGRALGTALDIDADGRLHLRWTGPDAAPAARLKTGGVA
jgi:poly-gamma-glutamate capsule biosynthesis protein CapA/YwtB (metallophosphatase superfamily)